MPLLFFKANSQSGSQMQNARLNEIGSNLLLGQAAVGRQTQQAVRVQVFMQNSPQTLDIMCLFGAYEQCFLCSSRERRIIKPFNGKRDGNALYMFLGFCGTYYDKISVLNRWSSAKGLNPVDLTLSRKPVWIQTYQSSIKHWRVGIELTFVDLLEHFIMDSSVWSQLMTRSLSLFIGIDRQLINKHGECVLGIWRLGQTGENIDYHNFPHLPYQQGLRIRRSWELCIWQKTVWKQRNTVWQPARWNKHCSFFPSIDCGRICMWSTPSAISGFNNLISRRK